MAFTSVDFDQPGMGIGMFIIRVPCRKPVWLAEVCHFYEGFLGFYQIQNYRMKRKR